MNKPKWHERWKELTGDHKFLEIKGWYDWQEKHYTTDYVRDYFGKDEDPDYGSPEVRVLVRWMMDWLRRQRGRMRHTLPNDPAFLIRRMNLHPKDANQAPTAFLLLVDQPPTNERPEVDRRFLIPTNEQVRDPKWVNKTKINNTTTAAVDEEVQPTGETPEPPVEKPKSVTPKSTRCVSSVGDFKQHHPGHDGTCTRCGHQGLVPERQGAVSVGGTAGQAAPLKKKTLREWDHDVPPYSAEQIRRAIIYHLDVGKNPWYRENLSEGFLRRGDNLKKLIEDVPETYLHPKKPSNEPYRWTGDAR
jgi:hypothetical protein